MGQKSFITSGVRGLLSLMAFRLRGFRAKITHRPVGFWQSKQNGLMLRVTSLSILSVGGKTREEAHGEDEEEGRAARAERVTFREFHSEGVPKDDNDCCPE
jgi:hypothetical protein